MLKDKKYTSRGFTLIELLVVIAIISMLSSVVLASMNSARTKARDARRLSDMKQMQTALEAYNNDHGGYPNYGASPYLISTMSSTFKNGGYIGAIPKDPSRTGTGDYRYGSQGGTNDSRSTYILLMFSEAHNTWCRVSTDPTTWWPTYSFCDQL